MLARLGVTHAFMPPAVLAAVPAGTMPGLECLVVGGEALPG